MHILNICIYRFSICSTTAHIYISYQRTQAHNVYLSYYNRTYLVFWFRMVLFLPGLFIGGYSFGAVPALILIMETGDLVQILLKSTEMEFESWLVGSWTLTNSLWLMMAHCIRSCGRYTIFCVRFSAYKSDLAKIVPFSLNLPGITPKMAG